MSTDIPPSGREPAAASRLQILATEHWSLLATRSLTYSESLARRATRRVDTPARVTASRRSAASEPILPDALRVE